MSIDAPTPPDDPVADPVEATGGPSSVLPKVILPLNPLFNVTGVIAGLFILTVFVMVAGMFGDEGSALNESINRYGTTVLLVQVAALVGCGSLAMWWEQRFAANDPAAADAAAAEAGDVASELASGGETLRSTADPVVPASGLPDSDVSPSSIRPS